MVSAIYGRSINRFCKNSVVILCMQRLLAAQALTVVRSVYSVTCAGLSCTPPKCTYTSIKGWCFCAVISVLCNRFMRT